MPFLKIDSLALLYFVFLMIGSTQSSFLCYCSDRCYSLLHRSVQIASSFQRHGLGRKLMEISKSIGQRCACKSCIAMIWKVRKSIECDRQKEDFAHSFLESVGFVAVEEKSMRLLNPNRCFMKLDLTVCYFVCKIID